MTCAFGTPQIFERKRAVVLVSSIVSKVNLTSSAVNGWPSCHFTPPCSLKVSSLPSGEKLQLSARSPCGLRILLLYRTRPLNISLLPKILARPPGAEIGFGTGSEPTGQRTVPPRCPTLAGVATATGAAGVAAIVGSCGTALGCCVPKMTCVGGALLAPGAVLPAGAAVGIATLPPQAASASASIALRPVSNWRRVSRATCPSRGMGSLPNCRARARRGTPLSRQKVNAS